MQATITHDKFNKALNYVVRAVSTKPNIPVLSNILLHVDNDQVWLSATNLDMGINMWIAGSVKVDGKVTVSGKFLADYIGAIRGDKVEINLDNDLFKVKTAKGEADFHTIPASEFPILPKVEGEAFFIVSAPELVKSLEKVIFACATDAVTSRIQLTGVLFDLEAGETGRLSLVGINQYRMSLRHLDIKRGENKEAEQLIIPARSLQELARILASEEAEEVQVFFHKHKSQVIFKFNEIEFSVRLLEGPYPEYKQLVPAQNAYQFKVQKSELEQAMKVVNTFARRIDGYRVFLDMDVESKQLTVNAKVADLGENTASVDLEESVGPNDLKDAYSLQYLMEMVAHMEGDEINFATNAPMAPAIFTDSVDDNYLHVIMAMQRED